MISPPTVTQQMKLSLNGLFRFPVQWVTESKYHKESTYEGQMSTAAINKKQHSTALSQSRAKSKWGPPLRKLALARRQMVGLNFTFLIHF